MTKTKDDLIAYLADLGIKTQTVEHPPLFTVEDSKSLRGDLPGGHCKNLFLRDAKGKMFLLVCLEDKPVNLKHLHKAIGCKRLSFGSPERLMDALGVIPGSVTPFAVINDSDQKVDVLLDTDLKTYDVLNFHPLTNEATTRIGYPDLNKFLRSVGHEPTLINLQDSEIN